MHEADLHNHTTASDGDLTPTDLVSAYADLGMRAMAITDHDTIGGLQEGLREAERAGIELVCGVEVTLRFAEELFRGSLHLLLYFSQGLLDDEGFLHAAAVTFAKGRGDFLVRARLAELNRWFGPQGLEPRLESDMVAEELYSQTNQVSRRHFAIALKRRGMTDREEVSHLIGNDSPAYIPSGMTFQDLAPLLQAYPFVRVLAHPAAGSFPGESHYKEVLPPLETVELLLPHFLVLGLDGLEVQYPGHTPELSQRTDELRRAQGLPLATGGSDCHDRQMRPPGASGVGYDAVERLRELLAARS